MVPVQYVSLTLMVGSAVFWLTRLDEALARFEPLLIIPLLQSQFILYATLSGGIFFQEFASMSGAQVLGFTLGIATELSGLALLVLPAARGSQVCAQVAAARTHGLEASVSGGAAREGSQGDVELVDESGRQTLRPAGAGSEVRSHCVRRLCAAPRASRTRRAPIWVVLLAHRLVRLDHIRLRGAFVEL